MQTVLGHYWKEIIPPRQYGDSPQIKHALRCTSCGLSMIVSERDIPYSAISVGDKILGTKVVPCDKQEE